MSVWFPFGCGTVPAPFCCLPGRFSVVSVSSAEYRDELVSLLCGGGWEDVLYDLNFEGGEWPSEVSPGEKWVTVAEEEGDQSRWVQWMSVVTKAPDGSLWSWDWQRGLTEMQPNEGPTSGDIVEVSKEVSIVQTVVTSYRLVDRPDRVVLSTSQVM